MQLEISCHALEKFCHSIYCKLLISRQRNDKGEIKTLKHYYLYITQQAVRYLRALQNHFKI